MSNKPFDEIADDYLFFQNNSTEAELAQAALLQQIDEVYKPHKPFRILDFGSGDGAFLNDLIKRSKSLNSQKISITVLDPVSIYRENAHRLLTSAGHDVTIWEALPESIEKVKFDLIISNHVFYYVPSPKDTVLKLKKFLSPNGAILLNIGSAKNSLTNFWITQFKKAKEDLPFYVAGDIEKVLVENKIPYRKQEIVSELKFPDKEHLRQSIIRFLLGNHLNRLKDKVSLTDYFKDFSNGTEIKMPLYDDLFIICGSN